MHAGSINGAAAASRQIPESLRADMLPKGAGNKLVRDRSPAEAAVEDLRRQVGELHDLLTAAEQRFAPVLRDVPVSVSGAEAIESGSPLFVDLQGIRVSASAAAERVRAMLDRCDL